MANQVAQKYEAAWLLDIYAGAGTIYAGTIETDRAGESTTCGAVYKAYIVNDIIVDHSLFSTEMGAAVPFGISAPSTADVVLHNVAPPGGSAPFDPTLTWVGVAVRLRRYERTAGTLSVEMTGVITRARFQNLTAMFSIASHDASDLDTLVPSRVLTTADFPSATDLGAPVPVVLGADVAIRPPYAGYDKTTTPGASDFLLTYGDGSDTYAQLGAIYWEKDRDAPGLEIGAAWATAPGTPVRTGASTFTVTATGTQDLTTKYVAGRAMRFLDGSTWRYTWIVSYVAPTVTIQDAVIPNPIGSVQYAAEYVIEKTRYTIASQKLLSLRFYHADDGNCIAMMTDTRFGNPADAIQELLTNSTWSIGASVDAATFATAETALSSAGLNTAVSLGLFGQQRKLRDVLSDLLALRGMRLLKGTDGQWELYVDAAPTNTQYVFGLNDGEYNNIVSLDEYEPLPAADRRVKSLTMRYRRGGRVVDAGARYSSRDYEAQITFPAISATGQDRVFATGVVHEHAAASRIADYLGKRLYYGKPRLTVTVGQEGRSVALGDIHTFTLPNEGISAQTYQVYRIRRSLAKSQLFCCGYNAAIYTNTTTSGHPAGVGSDPWWSAPTDPSRDESTSPTGTGVNLIRNPEPSSQRAAFAQPLATPDTTLLPGWAVYDTATHFTSIGITRDNLALGGYYLSCTLDGIDADINNNVPRFTAGDSDGTVAAFPIIAGQQYYFSTYADLSYGWRFRLIYLASGGGVVSTQNPTTLALSGETNGLGWNRYYCVSIAPATAVYCYAEILPLSALTYKFNAVQFEVVSRGQRKPSVWKAHLRYGVDPAQLTPGQLTVLGTGEVQHGTTIGHQTSAAITLSGASTEITASGGAALIPAGVIIDGITGRVGTNITYGGGGTAYSIGTSARADVFGSGLTKNTATNTITLADMPVWQPRIFPTATRIYAVPNTGTFAGGTLRLTVHYRQLVAPTS